jgi:V/A-type H+-transporting ATPase subunit K
VLCALGIVLPVALGPGAATAFAQPEPAAVGRAAPGTRWDLCLGAALSIGLSCLGAGYAIGRVGAAALGASSERPELLARSLLFVALGEGLVVFGFLIALIMVLAL